MNDIELAYAQATETIAALRAEVASLQAQVDGDIPNALRWLQMKTVRQRRALDRLNRRVVTQRFQLRTINEMGRGLSREEWLAAKAQAEAAQPQTMGRVDETLLVV